MFYVCSGCIWVHSRLGYYFWDKGIKDFVALDLGVYYDLLLSDQYISNKYVDRS